MTFSNSKTITADLTTMYLCNLAQCGFSIDLLHFSLKVIFDCTDFMAKIHGAKDDESVNLIDYIKSNRGG